MREPNVFYAWEVPPHEKYERGTLWWVIAGIVGLAIFVYAIYSKNFAFALMLIMFLVVAIIAKNNDHQKMNIVISDQGILVDHLMLGYHQVREFSILENLGKLYLFPSRIMGSHICIEIPDDVDINSLRMVLRSGISENVERNSEPWMDVISRKLKLF